MLLFVSRVRSKSRTDIGWGFLAGALSVAGFSAACGSGPSSSAITPAEPDSGSKEPVTDGGAMQTFVTPEDGGSSSTVLATALEFDPPLATLTVDGATPQTATFQLKATLQDGRVEIVSPTSMEFDRPDLASATLGTPVSVTASGAYGGTGQLHAIFGGREAIATLHVVVKQRNLGTVAAAIATALDGAGSTPSDPGVTSIQYPYDKTVFPLGLTAPLVMWTAPAGDGHANDVYRLHLQESSYSYDVYTTTPLATNSATAAQWVIDQSVWDRVTASNGGAEDPLAVVLSRYDAGTMTAAASVSISWKIAPASLRGAIYYWTASRSALPDGGSTQVGHITRMAPGTGALPVQLNSGRCMGCHAVSADGTTLVAAIDDPATAPAVKPYVLGWQNPPTRPWAAFDVSQATPQPGYQSTQYGADIALTPDGTYTVWGAPRSVPGWWRPGWPASFSTWSPDPASMMWRCATSVCWLGLSRLPGWHRACITEASDAANPNGPASHTPRSIALGHDALDHRHERPTGLASTRFPAGRTPTPPRTPRRCSGRSAPRSVPRPTPGARAASRRRIRAHRVRR